MSISIQLKEIEKKALSPDELKKIFHQFNKHINIISYDDIIKTNNLDSLFNGDDYFIIFYPNSYSLSGGLFGHYCCLIKNNDYYYFYDSYGKQPDTQKPSYNKEEFYKEKQNSLIKHFINSGCIIDYNNYKHQRQGEINTCGRHCLLRCYYSQYNNDQYNQIVKFLCKRYKLKNIDELVSLIMS